MNAQPNHDKTAPSAADGDRTFVGTSGDTVAPAGRLGVLICADSWYPAVYARMKEVKAKLLAVPSFGHGGLKAWTATWQGYDGWPNAANVDPKDVKTVTNSDAWLKYSLATRIEESSALFGINVFLHGSLWPWVPPLRSAAAAPRRVSTPARSSSSRRGRSPARLPSGSHLEPPAPRQRPRRVSRR